MNMSGVIESFFVGLGFRIDDGELRDFQQHIDRAKKTLFTVGAAATAAASAIGYLALNVADSIDDLADFAEREDVNIELLQKLGYASQQTGGSLEAAKNTVSGLNRVMGEAANGVGRGALAFKKFGLDIKDAHGKTLSMDNVLSQVSEKMQGLSRQQQIAMAEKLGIDREFINVLLLGNDELRKFTDEAESLGIVTKEDADKVDKFKKTWDAFTQALSGVKNAIGLAVIPAMTTAITRVVDWWIKNDGLSGSIEKLKTKLKEFEFVLSPVLVLVGALITYQIGTFFLAFIGLVTKATLAMTAFWTASFLPVAGIGLIIIAIGALIDWIHAAITGQQSWVDKFKTQFPEIAEVAKTTFAIIAAVSAAAFLMMSSSSAVAIATMLGHMIGLGVRYAWLGGVALVNAAKMAAAWVIATGPIGLAVAAVATAAGLIWANWDGLVKNISSTFDTIKNKINWFIDAISNVGQRVKKIFNGGAGNFSISGSVANSVSSALEPVKPDSTSPFIKNSGVIGRAADSLVTNTTQSKSNVTNITGTKIEINAANPEQAGIEVEKTLARLAKNQYRNGQSRVGL